MNRLTVGTNDGGQSSDVDAGATDSSPDAAPPDAASDASGPDASVAPDPRGNAGLTPADLPEASPMIGCAAKLPYAGPLCVGADCVVLGRSVLVPARDNAIAQAWRSALAIADDCRPHVTHSNDSYPFVAAYSSWTNGAWATEDIVSPAFSTAIVVDPSSQTPTVMVQWIDPVSGLQLSEPWQRTAGGWNNLGAIGGDTIGGFVGFGDFARGPDGTLHALRSSLADRTLIEHGTSATGTSWAFQTMPSQPYPNTQIALAPSGVPQFTFNVNVSVTDDTHSLNWATLGGATEEIVPVTGGPNRSRFLVTGIAGDPQAAVPHVIYDASVGPVSSVWYASRDGGKWHTTPIATSAASGQCPSVNAAGLACNYDYEQFMALAIVGTSDGQVRLLYLRRRYVGTATSVCVRDDGGSRCYFIQAPTPFESQLWIAWPKVDGSIGAVPLLDQLAGLVVDDPTNHQQQAALDSLGRIHLVADMSDGSLAYFLIGPSTDGQ